MFRVRFTVAVCIVSMAPSLVAEQQAGAIPYVTTVAGETAQPIVAVVDVTAWPNLTYMPDGSLIATIFNQPHHGGVEGDLEAWRSTDQGATWQLAGTPGPHDPGTVRMNCAAGLASNGDLLTLASGWDLTTSPNSILDPWLSRSSNNGQTWTINKTTAVPTVSPRGYPIVPYGDIVKGADGVLRAAVYDWPSSSNRNERAYVIESNDGGASWGNFHIIDPDNRRNETALLNLGGDNWLAVARTASTDATKNLALHSYLSTDNAQTWQSQGQITDAWKHPGHLMRMQDGRILLTYGNRKGNTLNQAVEVLVSDDEGSTWGLNHRVNDYKGPDGGYPSSVQLPDGQIVTAFYSSGLEGVHSGYMMGVTKWDPVSSLHVPCDLDFDGDIDIDDFLNEFVPNYLSDTSGLSPAKMYQQGDFNADGVVNEFDFLFFNEQYMAANSGASELQLPAANVPEPAAFVLPVMGVMVIVGSSRMR